MNGIARIWLVLCWVSLAAAGCISDDTVLVVPDAGTQDGDGGQGDGGGDPGGDTQEPVAVISVDIDDTVEPHSESIAGINGGPDRILAAVADDDGHVSSFVVDEVVLTTDSQEELDDFLAQYEGEILFEMDPAEADLDGLPKMTLIKVITDDLSTDGLADDIAELANRDGRPGEAALSFSSEEGARLVALAMGERVDGREVGINFVAETHGIPGSTEEGEITNTPEEDYHDAYGWDIWRKDTGLEFGVPEAWELLYYAGALGNQVKIAVIDGGFAPDADFPIWSATGVHGGSGVNSENPNTCTGGSSCPWHGTNVASAAMAQPDNRWGWAGTGGPIATGTFIRTTGDAATANLALIKAGNRNPKIINMSFGGQVNWSLEAALTYFKDTCKRIGDRGILIFASAGNVGEDVDTYTCLDAIDYCWEARFYYPCENPRVRCVGGLSTGGGRYESSNTGDNSLDIWAPWQVWVGPDPDDAGANIRKVKAGTSLSSPFAAGIAALVWAADPSQSASQVWSKLINTANGVTYPRFNAYQAVLQAMGTTFTARITSPANGSEHTAGVPLTAMAELTVISAPATVPVPVTVNWYTTGVGLVHTEEIDIPRTSPDGQNVAQVSWTGTFETGMKEIRILALADLTPEGWTGQEIVTQLDTVAILVSNPGPEVEILQPDDGSTVCQGQAVTFRGRAIDLNETLPDSAYGWLAVPNSSPEFFRVLGEGPVVTESAFFPDTYTIYLGVNDSGGAHGEDSIQLTILPAMDPACTDLPPQATITYPNDWDSFMSQGNDGIGDYIDITLEALASDPEDDDATLLVEWWSETDGKLGEGTTLPTRIHMTEQCSQNIVITLDVTDSDMNLTSDEVTINIHYVCK